MKYNYYKLKSSVPYDKVSVFYRKELKPNGKWQIRRTDMKSWEKPAVKSWTPQLIYNNLIKLTEEQVFIELL